MVQDIAAKVGLLNLVFYNLSIDVFLTFQNLLDKILEELASSVTWILLRWMSAQLFESAEKKKKSQLHWPININGTCQKNPFILDFAKMSLVFTLTLNLGRNIFFSIRIWYLKKNYFSYTVLDIAAVVGLLNPVFYNLGREQGSVKRVLTI